MPYNGIENGSYLSDEMEKLNDGVRAFRASLLEGAPPVSEAMPPNGVMYRTGTSAYPGPEGTRGAKMDDDLSRSPDGWLYVVPDGNGNFVSNKLAEQSHNGDEEGYRKAVFRVAEFHRKGLGVVLCNYDPKVDVHNLVLTPVGEVKRETRPKAVPPAGKYIAEG